MADTPTDRLGLRQMPTGSNFNAWGQYLNEFLRSLDQAIAGVLAVTLVGETAKTLDSTDFAPNEARSAALKVIGTPGGDCTLMVPAREKVYLVHNALTGPGYTLTLKTAAQSGGAIVPPNGWAFVVCDTVEGCRLAFGQFVIPEGTPRVSGSTVTLDLAAGSVFHHTCTGPTDLVFVNRPSTGNVIVSVVVTGAGADSFTFPPGTAFPGGGVPVLSPFGVDELVFRVSPTETVCIPLLGLA